LERRLPEALLRHSPGLSENRPDKSVHRTTVEARIVNPGQDRPVFRVAKLLDVSLRHVLTGEAMPPGICKRCGHPYA